MNNFIVDIQSSLNSNLAGLPSFCRLVIFQLLPYCDHQTGTISIDTLDEVARKDFYVDPSPGRKKECINADMLRNAFRTIKKAKPEQFKFRTQNQRILIEMPFLKNLYQQFIAENEQVAAVDAREVVTLIPHASIEENMDSDSYVAADLAQDVAAASFFPIVTNITKQHNKQTQHELNGISKRPIAPDFYPTPETISTALARGYDNVTDCNVIQEFVDKNTIWGSQFADFNPVYLRFLAKNAEIKQQAQSLPNCKTRSQHNESSPHKYKSFEEVMEAVRRANPNPRSPSESLFDLPEIDWDELVPRAHGLALATTDNDLRAVVSHETRTEG